MTTSSAAPTPVGAPGWLAEVKALIAKRDALARSAMPFYTPQQVDEFNAVQDKIAARAVAAVAALEAVLALAHPGPIYVRDEPRYDWTLDPAAIREAIESALRDAQEAQS